MGLFKKLFGMKPRAPEPGPLLPWPRDGASTLLFGARGHQREIKAAAAGAGFPALADGDHTGDVLVVTLVSPGPRETIEAWLDGQRVGELFNSDVERVRRRMMNYGRRDGSAVTASAPARISRKAGHRHGEYQVRVHV